MSTLDPARGDIKVTYATKTSGMIFGPVLLGEWDYAAPVTSATLGRRTVLVKTDVPCSACS